MSRSEVAVVVLLWFASVATYLPTPFGTLYWRLPDGTPMIMIAVALPMFGALIYLFVVNWRDQRRRSWFFALLAVAPFVYAFLFPEQLGQRNRFASTAHLRKEAQLWFEQSRLEGERIHLPENLKALTFGRRAFVSDKGVRCVYFPHVELIDNSEGLVYSPSGDPPEREAFWEVVRVRRFDEHWFWITTT